VTINILGHSVHVGPLWKAILLYRPGEFQAALFRLTCCSAGSQNHS